MRPDIQLKLLAFAVLALCLFVGSARAVTDIAGCQTLGTNGMEYRLIANFTIPTNAPGQCFNFTANNITLNGNNNFITWNGASPSFGVINISNTVNTTIKNINLNITALAGTTMMIRMLNSNATKITNVNLSTSYVAIFADGWIVNSVFINNNFSEGYPFFYVGATGNFSNNWFEGNKFTGCQTDGCFYCSQGAGKCVNTTFTNNIFNRSVAYGKPYTNGVGAHDIINGSWNWTPKGYTISIGNMWANYTTTTGFYLVCTDTDQNGICDTSFQVKPDGEDYAPLSRFALFFIEIYAETWQPKAVETRNDTYTKSIINHICPNISATFWYNGTNRGYTSLVTSNSFYNFTFSGIPNNLQGEINQTNITFLWDISCGSSKMTNTTQSHFVERLRVTRCAAPMANGSAKFRLWDENTITLPVIANFVSTFLVWIDSGYRNYSFSNTSYAIYDFCIFPDVAYNANISATYRNTSYSTRNYFAQNSPLSTTLSTIDLFMLSEVNSTNVAFTVYNINKIPQEIGRAHV